MAENSSHGSKKERLFSFSKEERLLRRSAFERVMKMGTRCVGKSLILEIAPSKYKTVRLGITVTRKFGSSPERNRFKRICREAFRLSKGKMPSFLDIHIRPKPRPSSHSNFVLTTERIIEELLLLLQSYTTRRS